MVVSYLDIETWSFVSKLLCILYQKNILSQYEFRKVIALAWLDPKNYWKSNEKKRLSVVIEEPSHINTRNKN